MAGSPLDVPPTQPSASVGFRVCDSLLAMPRRYHAFGCSFHRSPSVFLIFSPFVASFLSRDIQRAHVQPCPDDGNTASGVVAVL